MGLLNIIHQMTLKNQPMQVTIFDKIVAGQIPSSKVYEDDLAYVLWLT